MRVNVALVTHNRLDYLKMCLSAIRDQTYNFNKIVVLDNCSEDGTKDFLIQESLKGDVVYMKSPINGGASYGFYYSIALASMDSDWVWVMDDDVVPESDALEKLVDKIISLNEKASFFCSLVESPEGYPMNVPSVSKDRHINGYNKALSRLEHRLVQVDVATFVSILINVDAISKVGLPYKEFFIWADDSEYTKRMTRNHSPGFLVGDSKVIHFREGSKSLDLSTIKDKKRIMMYRFLIRNSLVYSKVYNSRVRHFITINSVIYMGVKYLIKFRKTDFIRFISVTIGILKYFIGDYNKKRFRDRSVHRVSKEELNNLFEIYPFNNLSKLK